MRGEPVVGVTVHRLTEEVDAGPILFQREVAVPERATSASLAPLVDAAGAALLPEILALAAEGVLPEGTRAAEAGSHVPPLRPEHGLVDFTRDAVDVDRLVRAAQGEIAAYVFTRGLRIIVLEGEPGEDAPPGALPGRVLAIDGDALVVAASRGAYRARRFLFLDRVHDGPALAAAVGIGPGSELSANPATFLSLSGSTRASYLGSEADRSRIEADRSRIETDLSKHEADLPKHEANLPKLEANRPKHEAYLPTNEADLPKHEANLPKHEANLPKHEADLPKHEADLPKHEADLSKHEADLSKHEADLSKHEADLSKHEADLPKHEADRPRGWGPTYPSTRPTDRGSRPTGIGSRPTDRGSGPTDRGSEPTDRGSGPTYIEDRGRPAQDRGRPAQDRGRLAQDRGRPA